MSEEIRERFIIVRQLDMGCGWDSSTSYTRDNSVPGRVLDLVRNELVLHLPQLEPDQLNELAQNVVKRLYRPEQFDFDKAQEADEHWQRGKWKS